MKTQNPIQDLFQTSWHIQSQALNRLAQRGNLSCHSLELDFRAFYHDCLAKLNDVYFSINNEPKDHNRVEQLSVIQSVKNAVFRDNFQQYKPPIKRTRLSGSQVSEQTHVRGFGYSGESEDDDDDSDLTILKQIKQLSDSETRVTINFKPMKKDSVPYDCNKLKEKDMNNLPTPKFLEEKGNVRKVSNPKSHTGQRSSAKFSDGNQAGLAKENRYSIPLVKFPSFKAEEETFSLGKKAQSSNQPNFPKSGEVIPSSTNTRKSLIPVFEEFNIYERNDIISLSDLAKINGAENVDLDNFSAYLEASHDRKSNEHKRQIKRKSNGKVITEEDPLPLATVIHNYNQQKNLSETVSKQANNQINLETVPHPSYFISDVPLQNEIASTPTFQLQSQISQTQGGLYCKRMDLDVILSEDELNEEQEKSSKQPFAYGLKSPYSFHHRDEIEYQDFLEMLENEEYDLSDYSSNESSNNGSYHFTQREESFALSPVAQNILAECGVEDAPIPMNTATFNDPYNSNSTQLLENQNTFTSNTYPEFFQHFQHLPETSNHQPIVDPSKLDNICDSPKKKRKIQRLYCNHKKVPLWASNVEEVKKISQIQKQDVNDSEIFGRFEIDNLNLAEIFGKLNKRYNQKRGSSANWKSEKKTPASGMKAAGAFLKSAIKSAAKNLNLSIFGNYSLF